MMNVESGLIRMTDGEFAALAGYMRERYGIDLSKKRTLIEGRLSHELQRRGIATFGEYMGLVLGDKSGAEVTLLLNKLTTNHSFFMRESEHFRYLQDQVLPLLERARSGVRDLRIWSAGCSTGQEPYNIAMVIDEYFGGKKAGWDTTILATDISMKALGTAQQGIYAEADLQDLPPGWKSKYFQPLGDGQFQVTENIRAQVVFRPFNLMEPFPFRQPFDLIFCRNVMIYFDAATKNQLIQKFYDHTQAGGFLFIGHSESITGQQPPYRYIQPAIYQKRG